jgi:hypothetical protein
MVPDAREILPYCISGIFREKVAMQNRSCFFLENMMTGANIANIALSRAWSVYLLINRGIEMSDPRRAMLESFIRQRCAAGVDDTEILVVEGLKHLKELDQSGRP